MKKWLLLTVSFFACHLLIAQETRVVVKIVDSLTLQPLSRASVIVGENETGYYSNDSGMVSVWFEKGDGRKTISITTVGYEAYKAFIYPSNVSPHVIKLKAVKVSLPETEVFPDLPAHLFFGSKETQVLDYVVTPAYTIIALYNYFDKRCKLVLMDASLKVIDEQPIPADFEKFHVSGLGYIYAITPAQVYEITIRKGLIQTKYITDERFYRTIQYYCGGHDQYLYLTMRAKTGQITIFFHEDTREKIIYQVMPFCVITDEVMQRNAMVDYRRPYVKSMYDGHNPTAAKDMVNLNDIFPNYDPSEGDIIPGGFKTDTEWFKQKEMAKRYGVHPVYTPFFQVDSGLLIFDFYRNTANKYRYNTELKSSDTITFHKEPGWEQLVLKNENDQMFTAYKKENGKLVIHSLNPTNFSTAPVKELSYSGITQIKISGQYIYYLYQPYRGRNNVFLFRERLTP